MAIDVQHLKQLLELPSERLDVELKGWLDLADNGQRGTLAKCLIALANHGGGIAIVGFDDAGNPAQNRPATHRAMRQARVASGQFEQHTRSCLLVIALLRARGRRIDGYACARARR